MPLEILLPIVVFGITGVVLLIRWLRPTPDLRLHTEEQAIEIWNRRNTEVLAKTVLLNTARSHALIETSQGPGLVWAFGADPVTRLLNEIVECRETDTGVQIITRDFTAPRINVPLKRDQIRDWVQIIGAKS